MVQIMVFWKKKKTKYTKGITGYTNHGSGYWRKFIDASRLNINPSDHLVDFMPDILFHRSVIQYRGKS